MRKNFSTPLRLRSIKTTSTKIARDLNLDELVVVFQFDENGEPLRFLLGNAETGKPIYRSGDIYMGIWENAISPSWIQVHTAGGTVHRLQLADCNHGLPIKNNIIFD